MSGRWERALKARQRMGRALDTGPIPAVTAIDAVPLPPVYGPEASVWTEDAEGRRRLWRVNAEGSLHEAPESVAGRAS